MARILVIPDVHLKREMFVYAHKLMESGATGIDGCVVLGDLVDDWDATYDKYRDTMETALWFDDEYPDVLWCIGNHDYAYLHQDDGVRCSGFSERFCWRIQELFKHLEKQAGERFSITHRIDECVFSHAGLSKAFKLRMEEMLDESDMSVERLCECANMASANVFWEDDSPLWFRPSIDDWGVEGLRQVVGHTPEFAPKQYGDMLVCDTWSTYSDGTPLGDQSFVVYDTLAGTWETVFKRS